MLKIDDLCQIKPGQLYRDNEGTFWFVLEFDSSSKPVRLYNLWVLKGKFLVRKSEGPEENGLCRRLYVCVDNEDYLAKKP